MQDVLHSLLEPLGAAERRCDDDDVQDQLSLLLQLLMQLRATVADLAEVPVGVMVARLAKPTSRVSEPVRELAVRCKRGWQALLQGARPLPRQAPSASEDGQGQRAAQRAKLAASFDAIAELPEGLAHELEQPQRGQQGDAGRSLVACSL